MNSSDSIVISVEGVDQVVAGFAAIARRIQEQALGEMATEVGRMVVEEAKSNAPVATTGHTPRGHAPGTLKSRGIGYRIQFASMGREILIGFNKAGWYGLFSEYGTIHISARPIIIPAYEAKKSEIIATMGRIAAKYIEAS